MPINVDNVQITGGLTFIPEILTPTGDPYWANVSLLMNNTTTNNQTNNSFIDSSTNSFMITRTGTVTQGSITPFTVAPNTSYSTSLNGGSGYFNGTSRLSASANSAFGMGTGDFTMECWVYIPSGNPNGCLISMRSPVIGIANSYANVLAIGLDTGSSRKLVWSNGTVWRAGSSVLTSGQWYHLAVSRSGSTLRLFVNGVLDGTFINETTDLGTSRPCNIGLFEDNTFGYSGYMSSSRIVKGTAVYTGNFTPPTSPVTAISGTSLLLNFTNGGVFDGATKNNLTTLGDAKVSTAQAKFGTTSVSFDGTGDYIGAPAGSQFSMGTGNFTLECWVYFSASGTDPGILQIGPNLAPGYNNSIGIGRATTVPGQVGRAFMIANNTYNVGTEVINTGVWYHVAVARSGTSHRLFVNGVLSLTVTDSTNYTGTNFFAGYAYDTNYFMNGFIQDLRITKGIARYTGNFTPPAAPFPTY